MVFWFTPSLQDGWVVCDLPVVGTTGFITLSRWDKEEDNTIKSLLITGETA